METYLINETTLSQTFCPKNKNHVTIVDIIYEYKAKTIGLQGSHTHWKIREFQNDDFQLWKSHADFHWKYFL